MTLPALLRDVRACTACAKVLPMGPRPVVQVGRRARILIASQAPGRKVHETGIPFNDVSGDRLRDWLGVDRDTFYDDTRIAILPMGFCFPGTGKSGDLPPRPECAALWRKRLLAELTEVQLTLVVGQYAQAWHLGERHLSVTESVRDWRSDWPALLPLPHPSPRNMSWLTRNPWFVEEVLPALREQVGRLLRSNTTSIEDRAVSPRLQPGTSA